MAYQTVPVMMTLSDLQGIAKLAFSNAISYTVVQQMTGTGVLLCSRSTIAKPFVYRRDVFPVQWKPSTHLRKFKTLATFVHHRTPEETGTAPYMLALRSTGFLMFSLYFLLILLANVNVPSHTSRKLLTLSNSIVLFYCMRSWISKALLDIYLSFLFLFCFTTLLIHYSPSFTSGLKPTCFTNPTPRNFTSSSSIAFAD